MRACAGGPFFKHRLLKHPRPRFSNLEIAEPEVRRLERIHLQYIDSAPWHYREKRKGKLKRIQNQILILNKHAETKLRIGFAVAEPVIAQYPKRIREKRTEPKTDKIPWCICLRLQR